MHISWARLASFYHLVFISDPLIGSKFHNETHDPKGQENKIYTIVKGRETFYRRHTVPVTSCSEVKYVTEQSVLARLFSDALWSPAGKGLNFWLSLVMSNCEDYYSTDLNSPRNNMDTKSINKCGSFLLDLC